MAEKWTKDELSIAVEVYRRMLRLEGTGQDYIKINFLREAQEQLSNRTLKSVEYRMQNISAVLDDLGRPWIPGFKPAKNVGTQVSSRLKELLAPASDLSASRERTGNALASDLPPSRERTGNDLAVYVARSI